MIRLLLIAGLLTQVTADRVGARRCQAGTTVFVSSVVVTASTPSCLPIPGGLTATNRIAVMRKTTNDQNLVQLPPGDYTLDTVNQCESLVTPPSIGDNVQVWSW